MYFEVRVRASDRQTPDGRTGRLKVLPEAVGHLGAAPAAMGHLHVGIPPVCPLPLGQRQTLQGIASRPAPPVARFDLKPRGLR